MSALPVIEPYVEPAVVTRPRTRRPEPVVIELPRHRSKNKSKGKAKLESQKRVSALAMNALGFVVLSACTFSAVSLAGQVMVEKARRDSISATARARTASREIAELRQRVQNLNSSSSIEDWAATNGFIPTESTPKAEGVNQLVALSH